MKKALVVCARLYVVFAVVWAVMVAPLLLTANAAVAGAPSGNTQGQGYIQDAQAGMEKASMGFVKWMRKFSLAVIFLGVIIAGFLVKFGGPNGIRMAVMIGLGALLIAAAPHVGPTLFRFFDQVGDPYTGTFSDGQAVGTEGSR